MIVACFPLVIVIVIVIVRSLVDVVAVGGAKMGLALTCPTIQTMCNTISAATLLVVDCCVVDSLKTAEAATVPSITTLSKHGA